jgi:signal recognition particle subunit SRP54
VLDAMTGQDAVNVAEQFGEAVEFDGVVDEPSSTALRAEAPRCRSGRSPANRSYSPQPARSSSSSSVSTLTRMAQRILGMGDVMSLIEKAGEPVRGSATS